MLIVFSGVPCSGKSTLATMTARHFKIPYFARDNLQEFLFQQGLVKENTVDGYRLLIKLAEEQINLGVSIILDATFGRRGFRDELRQIAEHHKTPFKPIYCYISNQDIWKDRWYKRQSLHPISHWMNPVWDDVLNIEDYFEKWDYTNLLSIDAMTPIDQNFQLVRDYLNNTPDKVDY